tara:strand:- start:971 stop:1252 length:282 start_codon:yes stop_codon:yes gene_type:complete
MIGEGRILLLQKIIEEGSINKAAKSIGMSYKKAWRLINGMNETSSEPIVARSSGGVGGGGTIVTEKGKEYIEQYLEVKKNAQHFFSDETKQLQ